MSAHAKILIVDDEPFNVDDLEQELEDFGYDTISATNGQEALAKVATEHPDLILLDVMMPLMDGFTVCRILKEDEATRLIPIVLMGSLQLDAPSDGYRPEDLETHPGAPRHPSKEGISCFHIRETTGDSQSDILSILYERCIFRAARRAALHSVRPLAGRFSR